MREDRKDRRRGEKNETDEITKMRVGQMRRVKKAALKGES